ncbi:MAG TPA: HAD family hydrolase [Bacteroidia bacterium]|nr:HAD family hydrolase [Bacteroidia bacterium]
MASELNLIVDKSWTLFLDRDGVINTRIENDYVKSPGGFFFLPGVIDAIRTLSGIFGKIVVVTNQQGIGKGLYTHDDLAATHAYMVDEVTKGGGRIDAIFYAHQLSAENSPMRKPGTGMALAAREKFPEINFSQSIMVGDTASDMEFARNAGMKAVLCASPEERIDADLQFGSLAEFASYIAGRK